MLFRKKDKLKREYDEKLVELLAKSKGDWFRHRELLRLSFDGTEELSCQAKIAEAKYFFLFREVKKRKISMKH
ncbi:MAG TPA: YaaL family protein [Chondromyces sp.]|nr:YaaL family protein [Chondromyces sp.]